jgi:chorismate synthase
MSSTVGSRLSLSIFGQSHAPAIGMTLEGIPAGETVDLEGLQQFLNRRAPGRNPWSTKRKEEDVPEFLAGLMDGRTCGTPLTAMIRNQNTRSEDYENLRDVPRPGHADFTAAQKFGGFQDVAGGGHFSGRLTAPLCIAGGICLQILRRRGIQIGAHIASIGEIQDQRFHPVMVEKTTLEKIQTEEFPVLDREAGVRMQEVIEKARLEMDSLGGIIECAVIGLPPGLGDPIFDGMENRIARLVFGIPAVKGIEFGAGFSASSMRGSEHNDPFYWSGEGVKTRSNHHGGILGGITSGMPLVFRAAVKPTPSIGREQESVSLSRRESVMLTIKGRHDPCIVPRAVPCMEAAAALAVYDALLEQNSLKIEKE